MENNTFTKPETIIYIQKHHIHCVYKICGVNYHVDNKEARPSHTFLCCITCQLLLNVSFSSQDKSLNLRIYRESLDDVDSETWELVCR